MSDGIVLPTTPGFKNLTGHRSGRLVVTGYSHSTTKNGKTRHFWKCECDCGSGREVIARSDSIARMSTESCGCLLMEFLHGRYRGGTKPQSAEYRTWQKMRWRCQNSSATQWEFYGGRGIKVCERWDKSFANFLSDMGPKPSPKHSIDRIDNDGDYCPENCRWATMVEQCSNRRSSRYITHDGQTLTLAEWGRMLGVHAGVISNRLRKGWSDYEALFGRKKK